MKEPLWIDREDALAIHDLMLAQHGGLAGVRELGLLESALDRPRHLFAYEPADLPVLAAAYARGIVQNHPFIDGNKRTGFMVAATFLEVNGLTFIASEASVVISTVALASREMSEADYASWLEKSSVRSS